jgi:cell division protein FtsW (lipid II flippase)
MAHSEKKPHKVASIIHPDNAKLFVTCVAFSLLHLGLMLDAYFSERDRVAYALIVLHGMLLALYVGPKEANRWFNGGRPSTRPGEFLVFLWIAALAFMGTHSHFLPAYRIPEGMLDTVLTLGVILFGTEMSKLIHGWRKPPCPEAKPAETEKPSP